MRLTNDPIGRVSRLLAFLLATCLLAACHTSRQGTASLPAGAGNLSCRVQLAVPHKDAVLTVNGTLKLVGGERLRLSFLLPVIRTEVARVEATPESLLLVDRMGKRYVQATRRDLKGLLPRKAGFAHLEKLIRTAARSGGRVTLTGKDLGIPSLKKGKMTLYDFSDKAFSMEPTRLSSRYREVEPSELLEMLTSL